MAKLTGVGFGAVTTFLALGCESGTVSSGVGFGTSWPGRGDRPQQGQEVLGRRDREAVEGVGDDVGGAIRGDGTCTAIPRAGFRDPVGDVGIPVLSENRTVTRTALPWSWAARDSVAAAGEGVNSPSQTIPLACADRNPGCLPKRAFSASTSCSGTDFSGSSAQAATPRTGTRDRSPGGTLAARTCRSFWPSWVPSSMDRAGSRTGRARHMKIGARLELDPRPVTVKVKGIPREPGRFTGTNPGRRSPYSSASGSFLICAPARNRTQASTTTISTIASVSTAGLLRRFRQRVRSVGSRGPSIRGPSPVSTGW